MMVWHGSVPVEDIHINIYGPEIPEMSSLLGNFVRISCVDMVYV